MGTIEGRGGGIYAGPRRVADVAGWWLEATGGPGGDCFGVLEAAWSCPPDAGAVTLALAADDGATWIGDARVTYLPARAWSGEAVRTHVQGVGALTKQAASARAVPPSGDGWGAPVRRACARRWRRLRARVVAEQGTTAAGAGATAAALTVVGRYEWVRPVRARTEP